MILTLRYNGSCQCCGHDLFPGDDGSWFPGWGVWCLSCLKRRGPREVETYFNDHYKDRWETR